MIYCNNFANNGLNAYDLNASSIWNNGKVGNYYSDFHLPEQGCYDSNHDNICDDPHEIQGKHPNNKSIDGYPSVTQRSPPCCPLRVQVIPSRDNVTVGQNITLTYVISNYGWARLGNIYLNNSKTGKSLIKGLKLEPDQSTKISQNYTIGDSDFPGPLNIIVNATGMDYSTFKEVSAIGSISIRTLSRPRICIKETPSVNETEAGQVITYRYMISNCGDRPLEDVYLNDSKIDGFLLKKIELKPRQSLNISRNYTIADSDLPGPLNNTALAIGTDYLTGVKVSAKDSTLLRILPSDLNLSLISNSNCIHNLSDRINFTIAVKNNGPGKAKGIIVHDSVPNNSEFIGAYPFDYDPNTGDWHLDSLAVGKIYRFYLEIKTSSNESVNDSAYITSNTTDPNRLNNYYFLNVLKCNPLNRTSKVHSTKTPVQTQTNLEDIQRKIDAFRHNS